MWGREPTELSCVWTRSRSGSRNSNVPLVEIREVLRGIVLQRDDLGWDRTARFRYPAHGGTGAIWAALAERLPSECVRLGNEVVAVEAAARRATLADGTTITYGALVSSMPLDALLRMITDLPDLSRCAASLDAASTHVVGIGFECDLPDVLHERYWLYFPEPQIPFHRLTVLSNYARANVPDPDRQWSVLCEVNHHPSRRRDHEQVRADCLDAVLATFQIPRSAVVSQWSRSLPRGYPVPTMRRDHVLAAVQPTLRSHGIISRGRFGGWRYEVSNQDHAFMQGVEAIDHLLTGAPEVTYTHPDAVNETTPEPELVR
jgi:protoporphyrinogen oxidase